MERLQKHNNIAYITVNKNTLSIVLDINNKAYLANVSMNLHTCYLHRKLILERLEMHKRRTLYNVQPLKCRWVKDIML